MRLTLFKHVIHSIAVLPADTHTSQHGVASLLLYWPPVWYQVYIYRLVLQMPAGLRNPASTFKEHIEQAWTSSASYIELPSMLLSLFQMTMWAVLCYSNLLHMRSHGRSAFLPVHIYKLPSGTVAIAILPLRS